MNGTLNMERAICPRCEGCGALQWSGLDLIERPCKLCEGQRIVVRITDVSYTKIDASIVHTKLPKGL